MGDEQTQMGDARLDGRSHNGTITVCAVPLISMQRHVEGRCGTESGPLNIS